MGGNPYASAGGVFGSGQGGNPNPQVPVGGSGDHGSSWSSLWTTSWGTQPTPSPVGGGQNPAGGAWSTSWSWRSQPTPGVVEGAYDPHGSAWVSSWNSAWGNPNPQPTQSTVCANQNPRPTPALGGGSGGSQNAGGNQYGQIPYGGSQYSWSAQPAQGMAQIPAGQPPVLGGKINNLYGRR